MNKSSVIMALLAAALFAAPLLADLNGGGALSTAGFEEPAPAPDGGGDAGPSI